MNRGRLIQIVKYAVYALLLLILYVLQSVPGLFAVFNSKPVLVVPAAIVIAMMEGEFVGGIYGAGAGLLWDTSGFSLFGFRGFFVCLSCICAGLLIIYLMHANLRGCFLYVLITMMICYSIEYLFTYGIWSYDSSWRIYVFSMLPSVLYTLLASVPVYFLIRKLHRSFSRSLELI